jgi:DNA gyrase/topoisomerase IV subunit B
MNWQELKASTMSEENRVLIQLTNEDLEWCEQILDTCMNDKSITNRKEFIMSDDVYDLV